MEWQKYVSVAALVVSVTSFTLTYALALKAATTSVRPILVFQYTGKQGWSVKNVGNGPALDVSVAMKVRDTSEWTYPVRIPPLSKDAEFNLKWLEHSNVRTLGARYADAHGAEYSNTCTDDLSRTYTGDHLKAWSDAEIQRHWRLEDK